MRGGQDRTYWKETITDQPTWASPKFVEDQGIREQINTLPFLYQLHEVTHIQRVDLDTPE